MIDDKGRKVDINSNISTPSDKEYSYLAQWRLENFKSVHKASINLAPLTLLVGPNSAGKSSLIQSILLFAQNARRTMRDFDSNSRGQIILNGDLVKLGTIEEARCDLPISASKDIQIGATFIGGRKRRSLNRFSRAMNEINGGNDELNWTLSLINEPGLEHSGTAIVGNVDLELHLSDGNRESCHIEFTDGSHLPKYIQNDRSTFSEKYRGSTSMVNKVVANKFNSMIRERPDLEYSAINFSAGLPTDGLQLLTKLERILEQQAREFSTLGFQLDELILKRIKTPDSEMIFERGDAKDRCIQILRDQLISEDKPSKPRNRAGQRRSALGSEVDSLIDLHLIAWPSLEKLVTENQVLKKLAAEKSIYSDSLEAKLSPFASDELDDAIHLEMKGFWEEVTEKAKSEFADLKDVDRKEWYGGNDGFRIGQNEPEVLQAAQVWNSQLASGVLYLEPLREAPKASYSFSSGGAISPQIPIGSKGEHLAQRLYDRTPLIFPLPGKLNNSIKMPLIDAVNKWLSVLQIEGPIKVEPQGRSGFLLTVGGRVLPMLGTGISQVLPVLTLCLIARRGDLILLEQPELHLNPSMQQLLADFLLEIAKTERQIIVETHSEYIVTRLRLNSLENSGSQDVAKILFVEKDPQQGTSYREVKVNEFGEIQNWPAGFFDQASADYKRLILKIAENKEKSRDL